MPLPAAQRSQMRERKLVSNWLNKKMGTSWRPRSWWLLLGGSVFVVLFALASLLYAYGSNMVSTWNFSTAGNYTYDTDKVEVTGGVARLRKSFTVTHDTEAEFNTGTPSNVTVSATPDIKITLLTGASLT